MKTAKNQLDVALSNAAKTVTNAADYAALGEAPPGTHAMVGRAAAMLADAFAGRRGGAGDGPLLSDKAREHAAYEARDEARRAIALTQDVLDQNAGPGERVRRVVETMNADPRARYCAACAGAFKYRVRPCEDGSDGLFLECDGVGATCKPVLVAYVPDEEDVAAEAEAYPRA